MQQQRAEIRYSRILDAALRVFSKRGYREASVDEIAGESGTSKGGIYFHFPNKDAIFLKLLDRTALRLHAKVEEAMSAEREPIARADAALLALLRVFAKHRALARLFLLESLGAGRQFHQRLMEVHAEFTGVIQANLDRAVEDGMIEPINTNVASQAWFGALNEVITDWVVSGEARHLEDAYADLRPLLMRSVGITDTQ